MNANRHSRARHQPGPRTPRYCTDLRKFEPLSPTARRQVDFLLSRGARVVHVTPSTVMLSREGHQASIDALGRVNWQA